MSSEPDDASRDDPRLNEILAQYLESVEAGRPLDPEQLIREHPEFADELREFLADKGQIDEIAEGVDLSSGDAVSTPVDPSAAKNLAFIRWRESISASAVSVS